MRAAETLCCLYLCLSCISMVSSQPLGLISLLFMNSHVCQKAKNLSAQVCMTINMQQTLIICLYFPIQPHTSVLTFLTHWLPKTIISHFMPSIPRKDSDSKTRLEIWINESMYCSNYCLNYKCNIHNTFKCSSFTLFKYSTVSRPTRTSCRVGNQGKD